MKATQIPQKNDFPVITKHAIQRAIERYGNLYEKTKKEGETVEQWLLLRVIRALHGVYPFQPKEIKSEGIRFVIGWNKNLPVVVTVKQMKDERQTSKIIEHDRSRVGEGFSI